ncbi:MAG: ABC transporter substrate-binding protein [SAR324 cluster bacterium]|nr:ABC transporter substrate-binding protein [SAR324 cluster bacterium]
MRKYLRKASGLFVLVTLLLCMTAFSAAARQIHIAIGDLANGENLNFLVAVEKAKERGIDIKTSFLKSEEIAAQAIVSGQADIGMGTPYSLMQKVKAPIRMFYQLSTLRFFPVVNSEHYQSWKDLDGADIAVHARGSGTEAIMMLMAKKNGIKYNSVSFVPGSGVRAGAMLKGTLKASIVNAPNYKLLMKKGNGKFKVLPLGRINASDEALYANQNFMKNEPEAINVIVEEMLKTWREINKNPSWIMEQRKKYGLLKGIPKEDDDEILPYYQEAVENTAFPANGGDEESAKSDFEFYSVSGALEGDPKMLKVEDFWDFTPLNAALAKVGKM